jgi:hypothetical protein
MIGRIGFSVPTTEHVWNRKRIAMTDPRYTDPWYSDPPPDTGLPQGDSISGPLGWIVGIAAVVLIAVAVFAGIHHAINDGTHPASDKPLATTESAPKTDMKSPSTTGFGGSSPQPMSPPARSGQ